MLPRELERRLSFSVETQCEMAFSSLILSTIVSRADSESELAVSRLWTEKAF